ncbi:sigma factor-like helix-turn-helix DNA-binding protein [Thermococcus sp.]
MPRLPEGMERVWLMKAKGMREVEIAESLGISRQAVNKALRDARAKLFEIFLDLAETFGMRVVRINAEKGFMVADCPSDERYLRVYAFYLPGKGVRAFVGGAFSREVLRHAREVGLIEKEDSKELVEALES